MCSISHNREKIKKNFNNTESHSIATAFFGAFMADKRKKYAKSLAEKYDGDVQSERLQ